MNKIIFITGGARSGKSAFALKEASMISGKKVYLATAHALDDEMRQRIEEHRRKRGDEWITYEEPLKIDDVIKKIEGKYSVIVIDCLTLWLSNLMYSNLNIKEEIESLVDVLKNSELRSLRKQGLNSELVIISNEVGMGIVPENELARKFRDFAGTMNQKIAEISDEVYMVVTGLPIKIK